MKSKVVYCWNCKTAMTQKDTYYQCCSCGATWNKLPESRTFIDIEVHLDGVGETPAYRPVKKRGKTLPKVKR